MTQTEVTPTASLTGKWKPYPAYKDSGVEWLGEIPAHWDLAPLYSRYSIQLGKMRNQEDITGVALAPYLRNVNIQWDYVDISDIFEMDFDPTERRKYALTNGDLLVCEGGEVGRTAIWRGELAECYIQNAVHRVRPLTSNEEGRFLFYVLYAVANLGVFKAEVNRSTIGHLTSEKLKKYRFMFPPLAEQRAIATFLDRETARINTLIAKKEQLIELLQEKRAALISHAVTKGLDPTVPMKDSGVEWLWEIPAHWDVLQLRRIVNAFVDYRGFTPVKTTDGVPLITARNIKNGILDFTSSQEFISEADYASRMVRGLPENGDVLITTEAPLGETAQVVDERVTLAQRIILLKVDKMKITNEYLKFYFMSESGKGELWSRATGSTAIGIKASHLRETLVIIPSLSEQQAIVAYLDSETAKIDALVSRIREGIGKLKEYSTALVSAAVTGKIDVRDD